MNLAFYPGCSLQGVAKDYSGSIQALFTHLGIGLTELDDWFCCGASAAHSLDDDLALALPAGNLFLAEKAGRDIVVPCAMCFNRLRQARHLVRQQQVLLPWPVKGRVEVHDMTRLLAEPRTLARITALVKRPLSGLKLVCYYGCQMVRPPRITGFTDYENPLTLDLLARASGADVLDWSYKATCCGASVGVSRPEVGKALALRLVEKARQTGAEAFVVSCPLCQMNLDKLGIEAPGQALPVFYVTELLELALNGRTDPDRLRMHLTDPNDLLRRKGLWK
jgi:heterodisulfide reductase subunit B